MQTLQEYITEKNAELQEWVSADTGRWAGTIPDADWWEKERDVHTVVQYKEYSDRAIHYDFYKDVHGIRPRWTLDWPIERIRESLDHLCEENDRQIAEDEAQKKADEAKAKQLCAQLDCTREDLTRWDVI